jgi:hypothetical protein
MEEIKMNDIILIIYLTGLVVSALCNIIYTFGIEQPKEKYKFWLIILESILWFVLFPIAAPIAICMFYRKKTKK